MAQQDLNHNYLLQIVLLVKVWLLTHTSSNFCILAGPISHGNSYLNTKAFNKVIGCKLGLTHKVGLVSEISQSHLPPPKPNNYTIAFWSIFLLTRGPSHRFFVRYSDVWLAVIDFHFVWKWSWFPQSLNSQRRLAVRMQRWVQYLAAALPLQCPSHGVTHCISARFKHMYWKTN